MSLSLLENILYCLPTFQIVYYIPISTITYLQHFSVLSLYMMNVYTSYISFWNLWANARLLQKIWFVFTRSIHCKKRLIPCFYSCQDRERGWANCLPPSSNDPPSRSPFYIFVLNSDLMTEQPKQNYPRWYCCDHILQHKFTHFTSDIWQKLVLAVYQEC